MALVVEVFWNDRKKAKTIMPITWIDANIFSLTFAYTQPDFN